MSLKVGFSQMTITPSLEFPVYLAGFGQNRLAESVHDELTVRALALDDGQTRLVLTALDLIGFFRSDVQEVIQRVHEQHPAVEVIIASIHTHHGPDTLGLWGRNFRHSGVDRMYMAALKDKIYGTILAALEKLTPTFFKTTSIHVPGVVKNARNPEIVDDELTLVQFSNPESAAVQATLYNFPCHPEVLGEHNPHITADYPGFLRDAVEAATKAPCIFFSGALGGMMTPDVVEHSFAEAEAMGKKLASAGLEELAKVSCAAEPVDLLVSRQEIAIKLTNPLYKIAFWLKTLPDMRNHQGEITSEVNLVRMGCLSLATVPGELLPKLGLALKEDLRQAGAQFAGIIGLANDELGYLLPAEDIHYPLNPFHPDRHYEETNSLGKQAGTKVLEGVRKLISSEK